MDKISQFLREHEAIITFKNAADVKAFRKLQKELGIKPPPETAYIKTTLKRLQDGLLLLSAAEIIIKGEQK